MKFFRKKNKPVTKKYLMKKHGMSEAGANEVLDSLFSLSLYHGEYMTVSNFEKIIKIGKEIKQ